MAERRRSLSSKDPKALLKPTPLPQDYLKMVCDVFTKNFSEGLNAISKQRGSAVFMTSGSLFLDEVILRLSIVWPGRITATTFHASADYDPQASAPKAEELLSCCVDALGSLVESVLDPKKKVMLEALASESLSAADDIPFEWTQMEINKRVVFVCIDKSNPALDQMADDWLERNDPEHQTQSEENNKESEAIFVTGRPRKGDS